MYLFMLICKYFSKYKSRNVHMLHFSRWFKFWKTVLSIYIPFHWHELKLLYINTTFDIMYLNFSHLVYAWQYLTIILICIKRFQPKTLSLSGLGDIFPVQEIAREIWRYLITNMRSMEWNRTTKACRTEYSMCKNKVAAKYCNQGKSGQRLYHHFWDRKHRQ